MSGSADGTARIWDMETHEHRVLAITVPPGVRTSSSNPADKVTHSCTGQHGDVPRVLARRAPPCGRFTRQRRAHMGRQDRHIN